MDSLNNLNALNHLAELFEKDKQKTLTKLSEQEQLMQYLIGTAIYAENRDAVEKLIQMPNMDNLEEKTPEIIPIQTTFVKSSASWGGIEEKTPKVIPIRTTSIKSFASWGGIAASVLIVFAIGYIFRSKTATELVYSYGAKEEISFVDVSRDVKKGTSEVPKNTEELEAKAIDFTRQKNYTEAANILKLIPQRTEKQSYILALNYFRQTPPDYNNAIMILQGLLKSSEYNTKSRWLLALSYIGNQQADQAIPHLKAIEKDAGDNAWAKDKAEKAKILLEKL